MKDTVNKVIELKGGVDEHSPALQMAPGTLGVCINYMIEEGINGGYTSVPGFERIDGTGKPSDESELILCVEDTGEEEYTLHQLVKGEVITPTAGLTWAGTALEDGTIVGNKQYCNVLDADIGDLIIGEELGEAAGTPAWVIGDAVSLESEESSAEHSGAWSNKRDSIMPPPGQGPVLGITLYHEELYVWRRKEAPDEAEVGMYVMGSLLAWIEIDTSADVLLYSTDGHEFNFTVYNFTADPTQENLYFCDGVQLRAREFNSVANSITTVEDTDTSEMIPSAPKYIESRKGYLILAFAGGIVQHSGPLNPFSWLAVDGAGQLDFGRELTGLHLSVGDTLFFFMEHRIEQLVGDFPDEFTLKVFSGESGAYAKTIQRMLGTTFFMDDRGITTLEAVEAFGDYAANTISSNFKKTLLGNRSNMTCSFAHRDLNQYRIYFSNGLGIIVSFKGKEMLGATYTLYPYPVSIVTHGNFRGEDGVTFFASELDTNAEDEDIEGLVFKAASGKNFDGTKILTRGETAFYHYGTPRNWKRFVSCMIEANVATPIPFYFRVDYDYAESALPFTQWMEGSSGSSGTGNSLYGFAEYGVNTYGGSAVTFRQPVYLLGFGTNMSLQWATSEAWYNPHSLQNIIVDYDVLGRRI